MKPACVLLYLRVCRSDGSRFFAKPVFEVNGRLRPHIAVLDGEPVSCPSGVYYLRVTCGGKRSWEKVGSDPHLALVAKERRQRLMDAVAVGIPVAESDSSLKASLAEAVATYIEDTNFTKSPKTTAAYTQTLQGFAESTNKRYLADLNRRDVLAYLHALRGR